MVQAPHFACRDDARSSRDGSRLPRAVRMGPQGAIGNNDVGSMRDQLPEIWMDGD